MNIDRYWSKRNRRVTLRYIFVLTAMFALAVILGFPEANANHGGPTYEHECPLPDGDPRGWPCTHTMPNGQQYIDWSYAYIHDRVYPMVPVEVP